MANPFDQKAITTISEAQAIQQLKQKFGGKRPLFEFLTVGCQKYLPPYDQCSCTFMLDIVAGRKLALNSKDIIDLKVPCYSEFSVESLMSELQNDQQIQQYLPELEGKKKRHSRKYLINVVSTVKPMFIEKLLERSNAERAVSEGIPKNSQQLSVSPEFQSLLANTVFQPRTKRGKLLRGLRKLGPKKERKKPLKKNLNGQLALYEQWRQRSNQQQVPQNQDQQ